MDTNINEAVSNAFSLASRGQHGRFAISQFIAELGEQGYAIVPVTGPLAWRDPTSGTPEVTPHEREVNEVVEAGRTLLRHGADSGNVRWSVTDTFDSIGLAPADFEAVTEAVFHPYEVDPENLVFNVTDTALAEVEAVIKARKEGRS
jgi:hypothetical protein